MLDELIKSIVAETVKQTLQELGALDQRNQNVPDTMTVKQLAQYLGMSEQWVYEKTKDIPHEKRGRKTLFIKSEIDEWRNNQREEKGLKKQKTVRLGASKTRSGLYKVI